MPATVVCIWIQLLIIIILAFQLTNYELYICMMMMMSTIKLLFINNYLSTLKYRMHLYSTLDVL